MPQTALIVIDMLNAYDHEDADALAESVREKLPQIVDLRDAAGERDDVMLAYVNDNHDCWDMGRDDLVEHAYLRGYDVVVPTDAVAHIHEELAQAALGMMERNMHADLVRAADVFGYSRSS